MESTDFYIDGTVNEYDLFKINPEQEVDVMIYATKETVKGKIVSIADRPSGNGGANDTSSTSLSQYQVKIELDNQDNLKHGLHVQSTAHYTETKLRIPIDSVLEEDGKFYVYRILDGVAKKTELNILEKNTQFAVVESGINQGDAIARNLNSTQIEDGQIVNESNDTSISEGV